MHGWTPESTKQWVKWMQWLDRWGYISACLSFLVLGMLIFGYSWIEFFHQASHGFLEASIVLINDLLLVIILLELFRTVLGFLQSERVRLEPFLHVGVIASVRKILTTGAELSHVKDIPKDMFYHYLMDLSLHVVIILVLMIALYLIRKSEVTPTTTITP